MDHSSSSDLHWHKGKHLSYLHFSYPYLDYISGRVGRRGYQPDPAMVPVSANTGGWRSRVLMHCWWQRTAALGIMSFQACSPVQVGACPQLAVGFHCDVVFELQHCLGCYSGLLSWMASSPW